MKKDTNNVVKSELLDFFKYVEKKLQNKKKIHFDTWSGEPTYTNIVAFIYSKGKRFKYNEKEYQIEYEAPSSGKGGMDEGSPETFIVSKVVNADLFDADSYLNKKVCYVADFMGGEERLKKIGFKTNFEYPINEMMAIVEECFESGYNVMIQRQENNVVYIWIDNLRFQQR